MCTVNISVHTKKVWKLIECTSYECLNAFLSKVLLLGFTFYLIFVNRGQ